GGEHRDVEPRLDAHVRADPEAVQQSAVIAAAPQAHVLAGVHFQLSPLEGVRGTAEPGARFQEGDGEAVVRAAQRSADPSEPAADHHHLTAAHGCHPASARTATTALRHPGSAARRWITACGLAAMRCSSWW